MYELVSTWKATRRVSLGLNVEDGRESAAASNGGTAEWRGIAGYSRIGLSKNFALCLRGETFDDRQGVRTGATQRVTEFTITPELKLSAKATLRADVRLDRSNHAVFESRSGFTTKQPTVQFNAFYVF